MEQIGNGIEEHHNQREDMIHNYIGHKTDKTINVQSEMEENVNPLRTLSE